MKKWLLILTTGLLIRLCYIAIAIESGTITTPDTQRHLENARHIITYGLPYSPYDAPLFYILLTPMLVLEWQTSFIVIVLAVTSFAIMALAMCITRSILACTIACLWLPHIALSGYILADSLAASIMALFVVMCVRSSTTFSAVLSTAMGIIAVFFKFSLIVPVCAGIFLMKKALHRAILGGSILISLICWGLYQKHTWGCFFITLTPCFDLAFYHSAAVISTQTGKRLETIQKEILARMERNVNTPDSFAKAYHELCVDAAKNILAAPHITLWNMAKYGIPALFKPVLGYLSLSFTGHSPENKISFLLSNPFFAFLVVFQIAEFIVLAIILFIFGRDGLERSVLMFIFISCAYWVFMMGAPGMDDPRLRLPLDLSLITITGSKFPQKCTMPEELNVRKHHC